MAKVKVSEIRAKFPMYADLSDDQLLIGVRKKYYPDIPMSEFTKRIEYDTERARLDPTKDMSGFETTLAGYGKALPDLVLGARQLFGNASQEEVDESKRLDAPLMNTTGGKVGNVMGNVAIALPAAAAPPTLLAAAGTGAVMGGLQPVGTGESRLKNTAIGGAAGAGGVVAGRMLAAGYQGARALAEPFTQAGRNRIAGRALQRFGIDAADVANLTDAPTVTGARTTLAEQIQRPQAAAGAARLQDSLRTLDPQIAGQMGAREIENNAARVNALAAMTGDDGGRAFALANRTGTSGPIYQEAFNVDVASRLTPQLEREMRTLLRSPAIREAAAAARTNASNAGMNVGRSNASGSVEGLHNIKTALDDAIAQARGGATSAAQETRARGLEAARTRLINFIESVSPEYRTARTVHAQMSRPLNQMDTAAEVLRRGTSATADLAGNPRLMPNQLARALQDENALVRRATGRNLGGLDNVMDANQLATIRAVAAETDRAGAVARAANGPGSATAQRLASQNVLRQILGPTGLPESWAESTLLNTAMRPVQFAYNQVAEPRIQQLLADIALNPSRAQAVLQAATPAQRAQIQAILENQLLLQAARSTAPALAIER